MARDLIKFLPKYYQNSGVMQQIMSTDGKMLDAVEAALNAADNQMLVATADEDLARWEKIFGLISADDLNRRRERILARKRGGGTGTIEHLKTVISSFSQGDVEITELYDQYMITIKFVGTTGAPPYLDDVTAAIDEIIPAHIGYTIVLQYNRWSDYSTKTWAELATKTWAEIAEDEL